MQAQQIYCHHTGVQCPLSVQAVILRSYEPDSISPDPFFFFFFLGRGGDFTCLNFCLFLFSFSITWDHMGEKNSNNISTADCEKLLSFISRQCPTTLLSGADTECSYMLRASILKTHLRTDTGRDKPLSSKKISYYANHKVCNAMKVTCFEPPIFIR